MKTALLPLFLLFFHFTYSQIKSKPITEFSQNDTNTFILIDVRTPAEFSAGHLNNAMNINWFDPDFSRQVQALDRDKTLYVYCQKGGRSARAAQTLDSLGYNVINLSGGYATWEAHKK